MKKGIIIVYLLLVEITGVVARKQPEKFEQFYREGMSTVEGILPVYLDKEGIYLEIGEGLLGREFLVTGRIDEGFGLIGRSLKGPDVFRIDLGTEHSLWLRKVALTGMNLSFPTGVPETYLQPIEEIWPVVAYAADGKGYIVDITDYIKGSQDWFSCEEEGVRGVDPGKSVLQKVVAFEEGVALSVRRMYGYIPSGQPGGKMTLEEGYLPMDVCVVIRILPRDEMRIRYATEKSGLRTLAFEDYGRDPYGVVRDSMIVRWNLKEPLVFYVDSRCPEIWERYIREGILEWNKVFKQMGLPAILQVRKADVKEIPVDRKLVVTYDLGKPEVKAESKINPRTGEILTGSISIGHGFADRALLRYLLQWGAIDKRIRQCPRNEQVMGELLKTAVQQKVGYLLGLKDDILDYHTYAFPQFVIEGKHKAALAWGYTEFPANETAGQDRRSLEKKRVQWKEIESPKEKRDPLKELESAIHHLKVIYPFLEQIYDPKERDDYGQKLREADQEGRKLYEEYLSEAVSLLGKQKGEQKTAICPQQLLAFLDRYLFREEPVWLSTPFLEQNPVRNRVTFSKMVRKLFEKLLSPEMMECIQENEGQEGVYTESLLPGDLKQWLFRDAGEARVWISWQMELETCYLQSLGKCLQSLGTDDAYNRYIRGAWENLRQQISEELQKQKDLQMKDFYEWQLYLMNTYERKSILEACEVNAYLK